MNYRKDRRRSSLFLRAMNSFYRSKGSRGADVNTLRGNTGADFESEAVVIRGSNNGLGLFSCLGWRKDSNKFKKKYIVLKGPHIFVFSKATSPSPKFAIPLKHETVNVHKSHGKTQVVTLETGLGDVVYTFKFDLSENKDLGNNFGHSIAEQIGVGNKEAAKEKLGHSLSFDNRKSLKYANQIGTEKERDQPEAPFTTADVMTTAYASIEPY